MLSNRYRTLDPWIVSQTPYHCATASRWHYTSLKTGFAAQPPYYKRWIRLHLMSDTYRGDNLASESICFEKFSLFAWSKQIISILYRHSVNIDFIWTKSPARPQFHAVFFYGVNICCHFVNSVACGKIEFAVKWRIVREASFLFETPLIFGKVLGWKF